MNRRTFVTLEAWLAVVVFYFFKYTLRSVLRVMMPQLTNSHTVNALGLSAIEGSLVPTG